MHDWLHAVSVFGFPRYVVLLVLAGFLVEGVLGRSKNPRFRSLASSVGTLLIFIVRPALVRVPALGPVISGVIDVLVPPAGTPCPACNGKGRLSGTTPVATSEAATKPLVVVPADEEVTKPETPSAK